MIRLMKNVTRGLEEWKLVFPLGAEVYCSLVQRFPGLYRTELMRITGM